MKFKSPEHEAFVKEFQTHLKSIDLPRDSEKVLTKEVIHLGEEKIKFGKYKGDKLSSLDLGYLRFISENYIPYNDHGRRVKAYAIKRLK